MRHAAKFRQGLEVEGGLSNSQHSTNPRGLNHRSNTAHRMSVDVGSTLSSSSMIRQWGQLASDNTSRSLKRPAWRGGA